MGIGEERNITPAMAVAILKKNGIEVSIDNAKVILDCLYQLANIAVAQCRNNEQG